MKNKKKIIILLIIIIACAVSGITAVYLYKNRYAEKITPSVKITADNTVTFYQKDDLWKNDSLGNSEYHMGDSGCLTTCIASELLMQNISVDEIPDITPGTLNEFFSKNNVYDSEGNLQWDVAGSALNVTFMKKETSEISQTELENLIERNVYLIVCVKMPSSGNYHFVLLVGSDEKSFLCMDPLNKDRNVVSMDKFSNTIYSVRYCEGSNIISDETIENAQIIDENEYYKIIESDYLYYYEIYGENNNIVKSDGPFNRLPKISLPEENLIKLTVQAGTGISTQWGYYYDIKRDCFSRIFYSIFDEYNGRMIHRDREKIIVRDIFDKTKYYYEIDAYTNPLSQSSEPFRKVQFVNNGESIEITYLTGDDYHEVTEVFNLP